MTLHRIVDENVDAPVRLNKLIKHPLALPGVTNIRLVPRKLPAKACDGRHRLLGLGVALNIVQPNVSALRRELERNSRADSAPRSRDECLLAVEKSYDDSPF